jgi:hypothetical protein
MTEITNTCEIDFFEDDCVSVVSSSNSSGANEKLAEIGLLVSFAIRMMSNLEVCETSDGQAKVLSGAPQMIAAFITGNLRPPFRLVLPTAGPANKRFVFKFSIGRAGIGLDLLPIGFGPMAVGMGYYGPTAVIALLLRLATGRPADNQFQSRLAIAAALAGTVHLQRSITLTNHGDLCGTIFSGTFDESNPTLELPPTFVAFTDVQSQPLAGVMFDSKGKAEIHAGSMLAHILCAATVFSRGLRPADWFCYCEWAQLPANTWTPEHGELFAIAYANWAALRHPNLSAHLQREISRIRRPPKALSADLDDLFSRLTPAG